MIKYHILQHQVDDLLYDGWHLISKNGDSAVLEKNKEKITIEIEEHLLDEIFTRVFFLNLEDTFKLYFDIGNKSFELSASVLKNGDEFAVNYYLTQLDSDCFSIGTVQRTNQHEDKIIQFVFRWFEEKIYHQKKYRLFFVTQDVKVQKVNELKSILNRV